MKFNLTLGPFEKRACLFRDKKIFFVYMGYLVSWSKINNESDSGYP